MRIGMLCGLPGGLMTAVLLSSCAATGREAWPDTASPRTFSAEQLYEQFVIERSRPVCIDAAEERRHAAAQEAGARRLERTRTWLMTNIGADRLREIRERVAEDMTGASLGGCPGDAEQHRIDVRYEQLLREIERRARAA